MNAIARDSEQRADESVSVYNRLRDRPPFAKSGRKGGATALRFREERIGQPPPTVSERERKTRGRATRRRERFLEEHGSRKHIFVLLELLRKDYLHLALGLGDPQKS
jgi:hypothetical protein